MAARKKATKKKPPAKPVLDPLNVGFEPPVAQTEKRSQWPDELKDFFKRACALFYDGKLTGVKNPTHMGRYMQFVRKEHFPETPELSIETWKRYIMLEKDE